MEVSLRPINKIKAVGMGVVAVVFLPNQILAIHKSLAIAKKNWIVLQKDLTWAWDAVIRRQLQI